MREVALALYTGSGHRRPCRLCGSPSKLAVYTGSNEYPYCASCVDAALERAEVVDARAKEV